MSEGRKPLFRVIVRNSQTKESRDVGTMWPLGDKGDGAMSLSLGARAYKDKPEVTVAQALALLQAGSKKGSGYFINVYPCGEGRPAERAAPEGIDEPDVDGDLPF